MIVEVAVGSALVAAAAFVWRRVHEKRAMEKRTEDGDGAAKPAEKKKAEAKPKAEPKKPAEKPSAPKRPARKGPRGLRCGDVLLYANAELWLAGCFELDEEGLVARVFHAPGNDRAPWVIQLDPDAQKIVLARDVGDEVPGGRVPSELPVGGMRLSLDRRGHADVYVDGEMDPKPKRAEFVRMTGPGGRELLVVDFEGGERLSLFGERTGRELFDFLPGGDD
ncbi:MAG: hypothetical protein H6721_21920 [Sandaracinus sp.]|nr:hypothetical protein [Myxococcales bacterium]MCB9634792.1 hypothetical protein [Sandaracinus sp.]